MTDDTSPAAPAGREKYVRYSPELGEAICRRVAAGESLAQVCRDRDMPHCSTAGVWTRVYPAFGLALTQALQTARLAARAADRARAAERRARGRDQRGRWSTYTPEIGEEICWRLAGGESLAAIGEDPEMPTAATILNWARENAAFADRYAQAREQMADYLFDEAREVALAATEGDVPARRLQFDTIRWMTARMAPRKYCERVVAAEVLAPDESAAARGPITINVVNFKRGPDGRVVVAPPRNAAEEALWESSYGTPYDGPRFDVDGR